MRPFTYERASTLDEALTLLAQGGRTALLGGGTNLVDHLRLGVREVDRVIDVSRLPLDGVQELPNGGVRIGGTVRNTDIAANQLIRQRFPFVAQAVLAGASGQLRNMATTAGNLMQRTRCPYFADTGLPCNKRDPGSGCSALEGFGRYNAVFGTSDSCVATHPSDLCVPLAALDAVVLVASSRGERRIPLSEFHVRPGASPDVDTSLAGDEIITGVELPALELAGRSHYRKVRDRASYAFALVSVAAAVRVDDGVVTDVRLGLGGIGTVPWRAHVAENALRGKPATRESYRAAMESELATATTGPENAFKVPLVTNTAVAVLDHLVREQS